MAEKNTETETQYQDKYELLMEYLPEGVLIYEAETGDVLELSRGTLELLGCSRDGFESRYHNNFYELILPVDADRVRGMIETQAEFLHSILVNFRVLDGSGQVRFLEYSGKELKTEAGGKKKYLAILKDVNEVVLQEQKVKQLEDQLHIETKRYRMLQETMQDISFTYRVEADELEIVQSDKIPSFYKYADFRTQEVARRLFAKEDCDMFQEKLLEAIGRTVHGRLTVREKQHRDDWVSDHRQFQIDYVSVPRGDGTIDSIVGTIMVSKQEEWIKSAGGDKDIDKMTGLLKKHAIKEQTQELLKKAEDGQTHALFYVDADDFEQINSNLGRVYGDEVIRFMAEVLKKVFRDTDLIGHIGADEYLIFMRNTDQAVAGQRAQILSELMRTPFVKDGISISITCSIGIACSPKNGVDFDTLYDNAEAAMCDAKIAGKNKYLFCI